MNIDRHSRLKQQILTHSRPFDLLFERLDRSACFRWELKTDSCEMWGGGNMALTLQYDDRGTPH